MLPAASVSFRMRPSKLVDKSSAGSAANAFKVAASGSDAGQ